MKFNIRPLWFDEDSLMEVRIQLAGNGRESWIEAYAYPEIFREFGQALVDFPGKVSDEASLELGSTDPAFGQYLLVRAFVHDGAGRCALEFHGQTRGDALRAHSTRFAVPTEAASLNELGRGLVAWASEPTDAFLFEGAGE